MILDLPTLKLKAVLAGNVSANQPFATVDYKVWNAEGVPSKPGTYRVALNNTTDVAILPASAKQGEVRDPERVSIYNKDTATVTVTVKTDDGTTEGIEVKQAIPASKTLYWSKKTGWEIF